MDRQLYVWARKQEIGRELAHRALVSEARRLPAGGRTAERQPRRWLMPQPWRRLASNRPWQGLDAESSEPAAQGGSSRCAAEQETIGRGVMFGIGRFGTASVQTKGGEIQQAQATLETAEQAQQNGNGRAWRWRVEPGMENAFQDLLGWMLPGQRGAEIETVISSGTGGSSTTAIPTCGSKSLTPTPSLRRTRTVSCGS